MVRDIIFVNNKSGFNSTANDAVIIEVRGAFQSISQKINGDRNWVIIYLLDGECTNAVYLNREKYKNTAFIFALIAKGIVLHNDDDVCLTSCNGLVEIIVNGETIPIDAERDRSAFMSSGGNIGAVLESLTGTHTDIVLRPSISERSFISDDLSVESVGLFLRELCNTIKKFDEKSITEPDVEEAILAGIITDEIAATELLSALTPVYFSGILNRKLFEACYDIWKEGDTITLEELVKRTSFEAVELCRIIEEKSNAALHRELFAKVLLQSRLRRRIITEAASLLIAALDKKNDIGELTDLCKNLTLRVRQ